MTTLPQTVIFNNQEVLTIQENNIFYVAMKQICENIGISWRGQQERIERDAVLNSVKRVIRSTGSDGKIYKMLCLPIQFLNGWLFGVDVNRLKDEQAKENLIKYKLECYQVLHDYWHKGIAVNPRRLTISVEQQKAIRSAVAKRCQSNSVHYQTVYTALYEKFDIPRYTELLTIDFDRAIKFIKELDLIPSPLNNSELTQQMIEIGLFKGKQTHEVLDCLQKLIFDLDFLAGEIRKNVTVQTSAFKSIEHQAPNMIA